MIHKTEIEHYSLSDLAEKLGNLRYDTLAEFLFLLSEKIKKDGEKDETRGRDQLGKLLFYASHRINLSSNEIQTAWKICEPFIKITKFKIGDKVHYTAPHCKKNGIIKSISDAPFECAFVVYNCADEWDNYQNYTGALTNIKDLTLGWIKI